MESSGSGQDLQSQHGISWGCGDDGEDGGRGEPQVGVLDPELQRGWGADFLGDLL